MNKIEQLLKKYCPNGVEFYKLSDIAEVAGAGVDKKINPNERIITLLNYMDVYRNLHLTKDIPTMKVSANDLKIKQCNVLKGDVFITPSSEVKNEIGFSAVAMEDMYDTVYSYHIMRIRLNNPSFITSQFISYLFRSDILQKEINKQAKGLTRFGLTKTQWEAIKIPIPHIEVQKEIVKVLDTFTQLEAELEAELEARKKQYEYYRNKLLTFGGGGVEYKTLYKVVNILDNLRKPISKGNRQSGEFPYYGANGIQDYVNDYIFDGTFLLLGEDGSVINKDGTPVLNWATGKMWVNNHAHVLSEKSDEALLRYIYFALSVIDVTKVVKGNIPKITQTDLKSFQIPVPSLEKQQEIVVTLDKFDALVNDISVGLPAELQARRQQYEYYRNKLLTFNH